MLGRFIITLTACVCTALAATVPEVRRVIVDVDAGIDDFQALVYLLNADRRGQIKIAAIVLSDGNTALDDVKVNVCRLLQMVNVRNIPIYAGSANTIMKVKVLDHFFGSDGFADLGLKKRPNLDVISKVLAPTAIAEMVKLRPNYYDYIALGPLTNLALAMTMYEHVSKDIGDVFIMGGNFGVGSPAEFNFLADPESANIVLKTAVRPVTLFPFQSCINKEMTVSWRAGIVDQIKKSSKNAVWNLNDMAEQKLFSKWEQLGYELCDPILVSMMLQPELMTGISLHKAKLELCGEDRAKLIIIEDAPKDEANVKIIHGFHAKTYHEIFVNEFNSVCRLYRCDSSYLR